MEQKGHDFEHKVSLHICRPHKVIILKKGGEITKHYGEYNFIDNVVN